jgi:hypothetical protein
MKEFANRGKKRDGAGLVITGLLVKIQLATGERPLR